MSKWIPITEKEPVPGEWVWGWDCSYGGMHLARWDGKSRTDAGLAWLDSEIDRGDDYAIYLWQPCVIPANPRESEVEQVNKAAERAFERRLARDNH